MSCRQAQSVTQSRPAPGRRPGWPATRRRSPRSTAPAPRSAPTRRSRPPLGSAERSASVRVDPRPFLAAGQLDEVVDRARARCPTRPRRSTTRRIRTPESGTAAGPRSGPSNSENTRSAGTKTSSATVSWLPVPRRPSVCQVSRTWRSSLRSATTRRHALVVDQAAGEHHVGVVDPAAERPAARHHDAAVDRPAGAARRPHAGGDAAPVAEQSRRGWTAGR